MAGSREWRAALAATAAAAGTGYASGRELVLFFSQTGWAGWLGIPFASAVFGLLMALACRCAARADTDSLALALRRLTGPRWAAIAAALHGTLLAMTALVMLFAAGETGALTLPVSNGFLWGALLALLIALLMNLSRLRSLPWLGLAVALVGLAFYGGLALDPRPVRVHVNGEVALALEGRWAAALLLALIYAAMNACLAAHAAARFSRGLRPGRVGAQCAALLCTLLTCACAAIGRGGRLLLGQALPSVILSARWGLTGFWLCAAFTFLCAVTTLAAALGGLSDHLRHSRHRRGAWALTLAAGLLCATLGLGRAVGMIYPAAGWLCAALLLGFACRAEKGMIPPPK